jgi:hypothetical protein
LLLGFSFTLVVQFLTRKESMIENADAALARPAAQFHHGEDDQSHDDHDSQFLPPNSRQNQPPYRTLCTLPQ